MDLKTTFLLQLTAIVKSPIVAFLGITVEEVSATTCKIRVPFRFRVKNPAGSMFLGALTSGADVAGSLAAYLTVRRLKASSVSILFKDMEAKFLKKAVSDTIFICNDIEKIESAIKSTLDSGEKVEVPVHVNAYAKGKESGEVVASFRMTLSVKRRS